MFEGVLAGVVGVVVLFGAFIVGGDMGASAVASDCNALGKARIGRVVYVCAPEKK
jgi:hypothetical protein